MQSFASVVVATLSVFVCLGRHVDRLHCSARRTAVSTSTTFRYGRVVSCRPEQRLTKPYLIAYVVGSASRYGAMVERNDECARRRADSARLRSVESLLRIRFVGQEDQVLLFFFY